MHPHPAHLAASSSSRVNVSAVLPPVRVRYASTTFLADTSASAAQRRRRSAQRTCSAVAPLVTWRKLRAVATFFSFRCVALTRAGAGARYGARGCGGGSPVWVRVGAATDGCRGAAAAVHVGQPRCRLIFSFSCAKSLSVRPAWRHVTVWTLLPGAHLQYTSATPGATSLIFCSRDAPSTAASLARRVSHTPSIAAWCVTAAPVTSVSPSPSWTSTVKGSVWVRRTWCVYRGVVRA